MGAYDEMSAALKGLIADIRPRTVLTKKPIGTFGFGYPAFGYLGNEKEAYNYFLDTATVLYDADFVTSNSIAFSVNGVAITPVVFATSHAATMTALIVAIDALAGVEALLDATDVSGNTILIRTIGATAVTVTTVTLGATQAAATYAYTSDQVFLGVVLFSQKETGTYTTAGEDAMPVLEKGAVWVEASAALEANAIAYVSAHGTFGTSGYAIDGKYETDAAASAALVRVETNGKYKLNTAIAW